jgi:hypothetical protein
MWQTSRNRTPRANITETRPHGGVRRGIFKTSSACSASRRRPRTSTPWKVSAWAGDFLCRTVISFSSARRAFARNALDSRQAKVLEPYRLELSPTDLFADRPFAPSAISHAGERALAICCDVWRPRSITFRGIASPGGGASRRDGIGGGCFCAARYSRTRASTSTWPFDNAPSNPRPSLLERLRNLASLSRRNTKHAALSAERRQRA